ncbi:hypothetical protein [Erythrobacter oryzae]|uniref:hypothetical protein n=1 Tax=Erythrobacter oryzae TaxID=3019556 RepID=UPI0025538DE9|nr:hypothetical protein [Erythrobacter sp. COR-2]
MSEFEPLFAELRALMQTHAAGLVIADDTPGHFVMNNPHPDPAAGRPEWFGTVAIKKAYVAYHLFPLYTHPMIGEGMSAALTRRRQGKSCFNFRKPDPALFAELARLTETAAALVRG